MTQARDLRKAVRRRPGPRRPDVRRAGRQPSWIGAVVNYNPVDRATRRRPRGRRGEPRLGERGGLPRAARGVRGGLPGARGEGVSAPYQKQV